MILGLYIKRLLEENKRVVLAGFGNLEMKTPEETSSPSGTRIEPPGISVRFDSSYSKDDGLLAETYARGEDLDEDEARQRVLELIDAIKFALDRGNSYTLPEAGTFVRSDDGKVSFQVDSSWLLEPDQYGLEAMDLLELEEEALPEAEAVSSEKAPKTTSKDKASEAAPKVTPLAPREPKPKPRRWRVVWLVAFLLIIVLAVLIIIPTQPGEDGQRRSFLNRKASEEMVDDAGTDPAGDPATDPTEVGTGTVEEGTDDEQQAGEATQESPDKGDASDPLPEAAEPQYFVIAGSFSKLRNASDLQDQLKQKGYDAEVMITENRMYRVSVASFVTKEEGAKGLAEIKKIPGLESCWLLSN